ncbi:MAG: hypothetical protein K8U03_08655 [Planctomycetia bacterium]|nr:hypothetical protein [Planctomycetia bacterium]
MFLSLLTGALIGGVLFSVYLVVSCVLLDRLDAITDASPYVAAFGAVIGLIFGSRGIHYHFDLRDEAIRRRLAVRPLGVR